MLRPLLSPIRAWQILVAVCVGLYLFGLGGPYAPTNGDEMVYIHIARMTAESGQWLPLQSELIGTRNTKPPLLIWQAMAAGDWGNHWSLFRLRLPSVLYTFATTALVAFFAFRLSLTGSIGGSTRPEPVERQAAVRVACLAAALYLLFFSTFRYGRAYLTSAPETFWLALPMWWLLWCLVRPVRAEEVGRGMPGWAMHLGFGVCMGLGAAYKSFALLAPAAATLWCALVLMQWPLNRGNAIQTLFRISIQTGLSTLIGLGIFALWFVLDPDPAAVWQEFVVAENAGKMSGAQGYWHSALFGAYPMWTQLLAYPANAGLLFFAAFGFCLAALRAGFQRQTFQRMSKAHGVLVLWLVIWLVIFTIPSQRSERYVIPAMPALALLMAFAWPRIGRFWHSLTLLVCIPALIMLGRIGWTIGQLDVGSGAATALTLTVAGAGLAVALAGLIRGRWTANASLVATLAVLLSFGAMVQPISDPDAHYSADTRQQIQGKRVAVPNGFTGQYERFHFVLRGARITPYDAEGRNTGALYPDMDGPERLQRLMQEFDAVVWLQDDLTQTSPACVPGCRVLAQRWHVKSRHKSGEITLQNLWYPQEWLFRREWLIVHGPA